MSRLPTNRMAVVRLAQDLPLPAYQSSGAAGMDLYAAVLDTVRLYPGERMHVPCGIKIAIPVGYEAQVRGRSGLRLKHGIICPVGTIDSDYRGEVAAILFNLGKTTFEIRRGDRVAQMIIAPVEHVRLVELTELDETARGDSGFGSTGKR